jgi:ABC-type glycerol-3-phosphate transport system permease component
MNLTRKTLQHLFWISFTLIWSYPFIWMVSSAFKTDRDMLMNGLNLIPQPIVFDNFIRAWKAAKFNVYFFNTVSVTVAVVLIVVLVTSAAGYALGRGKMPGKKIIVAALVGSMFLPKGSMFLPVFKLIHGIGLNNHLFGIILAEAGTGHIIAILLFMSYFINIPKEIEESAMMDGAKFFRILYKIMFPLARPVIGTVAIMNFIGAWNSFFYPLIFTLSKPKLRTLGVGMFSFFSEDSIDWTGLAAAGIITVVPILIVFLSFQKYFIEGLAGSVKG